MSTCPNCARPLGRGRFCIQCGAPVTEAAVARDWRTDTAERRPGAIDLATPPHTPASAVAPPLPPRYPLYADEVADQVTDGAPYGAVVATTNHRHHDAQRSAEVSAADQESGEIWEDGGEDGWVDGWTDEDWHRERRSPWRAIMAAIVVVSLAAGAWWYAVGRYGDHGPDQVAPESSASKQPGLGVDVARQATATVPATAPPNQDVGGERVSYDASNMLDGVPETTWRVAGSATSAVLTFTLARPTELTRVGLINGFSKTSTDDQGRSFDSYVGNRRVTEVTWILQGGTKVRQRLSDDDRALQMIDIDPVTTARVVLRIVKVSAPGDGNSGRNYTAISEVSLIGTPES